jgi:hypothetical protein
VLFLPRELEAFGSLLARCVVAALLALWHHPLDSLLGLRHLHSSSLVQMLAVEDHLFRLEVQHRAEQVPQTSSQLALGALSSSPTIPPRQLLAAPLKIYFRLEIEVNRFLLDQTGIWTAEGSRAFAGPQIVLRISEAVGEEAMGGPRDHFLLLRLGKFALGQVPLEVLVWAVLQL